MAANVCPECGQGKHRGCDGDAWDFDADEGAVCPCWKASGARAGEPCKQPDGKAWPPTMETK